MTDHRHSPEDRFARVEKMHEELRAVIAEIESKLDLFHQEFQRTATAVQRIGLKQDSAKTLTEKHAAALYERLDRIEVLIRRK